VEHFTTAAYFEKLSNSTMRMLRLLGINLDDPLIPWTEMCRARFLKELSVGDVYHITAGVVEAGKNFVLLGHRLFNSDSGELCSTFLQKLTAGAKSDASPFQIEWDDGEPSRKPDPDKASEWLQSSASIVRPDEVDWAGRFDLGALINQLSAANIQTQTSVGMSPSYMRSNRKGFSTAEYQLQVFEMPPGVGVQLESRSAIVHVGRTSIWLVHKLYDCEDEKLFARLGQLGVHLDLDARKPSPLPDEIRERALAGLKQ
jgi:acyl-CoA thioesterase FadM